jgi:hypothetical protein
MPTRIVDTRSFQLRQMVTQSDDLAALQNIIDGLVAKNRLKTLANSIS